MDYIAVVSSELSSGDLGGDNGGTPYFLFNDLNVMLHKNAFGSQSHLYTCPLPIQVDVSDHMQLDFCVKLREVFRTTNPNDSITRVVFPDFTLVNL
jgi:hypothetical protein